MVKVIRKSEGGHELIFISYTFMKQKVQAKGDNKSYQLHLQKL